MAKMVILGEAYGVKEDMFQHAFVGASGVELARMLIQSELTPPLDLKYPTEMEMISYWQRVSSECDIHLLNVFNAHPEDNNIELFFTNAKEGCTDFPPLKPGKYLRSDMLFHLHNVWKAIESHQPNVILALGNTAAWATLGESKITQARGTVRESPRLGVKVIPTYHPAFILRQWPLRTIVLSDFAKAKREAETPAINRVERWLTVDPTLDEITAWTQRDAPYYAVDIETYRGQITMIGFARNPFDALVIPFYDKDSSKIYWPTPEDETKAWRFVEQLLNSPAPKIFQNGVYDLSYILRMGFRPRNCKDDTMLLHHALYAEMQKSLGFLGSIYTDERAWKRLRSKDNTALKREA